SINCTRRCNRNINQRGVLKRSSLRLYNASRPDEHGMKDGDSIIFINKLNTLDHLLILTIMVT
ncbi:hypothetical protein, partial [Enterococcus faecalis]|uniref:hypothetical protein n=1 Tax=Enterococcus faecalis TaxID=1351 RepID=UPI003CC64FD4